MFYKYFQVFTILPQASWWTLILLQRDTQLDAVEHIPAQATTAQWWPQSERWTCLSQYTRQSWIDSFKQVVESCLCIRYFGLVLASLAFTVCSVYLRVCVSLFFLWWSVQPGATEWWMVEEDDRSLRWPSFAGNGGEMRYEGRKWGNKQAPALMLTESNGHRFHWTPPKAFSAGFPQNSLALPVV